MLKQVTVVMDATDPQAREQVEVEDLSAYLASRFERFPDNTRIYHEHVAVSHDVTPSDPLGVERLAKLPGPFFVVTFPGNPAAIAFNLGVTLLLMAVSAALAKPAPDVVQRNQSASSPNNEFAERTNRARPNGRVPDIFGTVRSTPDLIAPVYKVFENNVEVEYSYMCVGRGHYDISDIRDGDTLCLNIPGTTVQVYAPFTSPNSGHAPQVTIGTPRSVPVIRADRSNSVNGQVLRPPNVSTFVGEGNVRFVYPNMIELAPSSPKDFTESFVEGDIINVSNAAVESGEAYTETLQVRATVVDLRQTYGRSLFIYEYDTTGGSLLIPIANSEVAYGLFAPGATITITQVLGDFNYPGLNLSGTYTVDSVVATEYASGSTGNQQRAFEVPMFVIVKLVNPAGVNAAWNDLEHGGDSWDWLTQSAKLTLEIGHGGGAVGYDADLAGTYTVLNVTQHLMVLDNPAAVNTDWNILDANGDASPFLSATIASTEQGRWVGPFVMPAVDADELLSNFVAQNGLYKDDGTDQVPVTIQIEVMAWPVDGDDVQIDDAESFTITLSGSATLKETVAATLKGRFASFYGRFAAKARRVTAHDDAFEGTVVDEVRWRDLYSVAYVENTDFGDVTTVQAVIYATASALAVKERKLNMLASRRLPVYDSGTNTFDDENLVATENAADIFVSICRDRYNGNRRLVELDLPNIYDTRAAVVAYFGHESAGNFSYTFDQDTMSFEEMAALVAQAMFCIAYRRGNKIRLSFERQTDSSTLLFNHRNKVPKTERRTVSFGYTNDNDGIEYAYVNPADDSSISVFLPLGYAAINPKRVQGTGIRNHLQAYFHAWREWNKLQYQYLGVEFEATSESELLLRNDRILVADNTRPGTQDGEVVSVDTLELTLSQAVDLTGYPSHVIHLQHYDGSVESIGITAGTNPNQVVLDDPPAMPLATDPEGHVRTGYVITGDTEARATAFLVTERETLTKMTSRVSAVNYDDRYYANDLDFINEVITENGYGPTGGFTPGPMEPPYNGPPGPSMTLEFTAEEFPGAPGVFGWSRSFYAGAVGSYEGEIEGLDVEGCFSILDGVSYAGQPDDSTFLLVWGYSDPTIAMKINGTSVTFDLDGYVGGPYLYKSVGTVLVPTAGVYELEWVP